MIFFWNYLEAKKPVDGAGNMAEADNKNAFYPLRRFASGSALQEKLRDPLAEIERNRENSRFLP